MNIETREIRDESVLTAEERESGKWVRVAPKMAKRYEQKQPVTDGDYRRILAAEGKRLRKMARNLDQLRRAVP